MNMKNSRNQKKKLFYTSSVLESTKKGELFIELYPCAQQNTCEKAPKTPIKTIRNFDELIDFFESEEAEEL